MLNIQKYHGKCVLNVQKAKHKNNIIYISNTIEELIKLLNKIGSNVQGKKNIKNKKYKLHYKSINTHANK